MRTNSYALTYEVLLNAKWYKARRAAKQTNGWLHYELKDGTIGMADPKNWRQSKR